MLDACRDGDTARSWCQSSSLRPTHCTSTMATLSVVEMLQFLPLASLFAIAVSTHRYRDLVVRIICWRIWHIVTSFFSRDNQVLDNIFNLLRLTGSATGGSTFLALLEHPDCVRPPNNLNVFVPRELSVFVAFSSRGLWFDS